MLYLSIVALLVAFIVHEHAANLDDSPYKDSHADEAYHNLAYALALQLFGCKLVIRLGVVLAVCVVVACVVIACVVVACVIVACVIVACVIVACVIVVCLHFLSCYMLP